MSTKYPSPLLGYNNNVRHKSKVFHIQTEDSGVKYGHIITHLFMDGGRILKSVKTSYAEYLGNERLADVVREMMKQQHKAMFIALRDGKFDPMSEGRGDGSRTTRALVAESPPVPPSDVAASPSPSEAASPAVALDPSPDDRTQAANARPSVDTAIGPFALHPPASAAELTLDIDALERAAAANATAPVRHTASDLPPPPASLFREKAPGNYRMSPVPEPLDANPSRPVARPSASATTPLTPPPPPAGHTPSPVAERRYAPTRPASIFGQTRPQQGKSIFGEDLISDKSLDEVILSYLAEDLDEKE
jgi:hypothetical protein